MGRGYNWSLGALLLSTGLVATQSALAAVYSCERYSAEPSGFSSMAAFDSWFPPKITLNSAEGEKEGNQLLFKTTYQISNGGNFVVLTTRLLPNGKAISGLSVVGGFRQTGNARYKCNK